MVAKTKPSSPLPARLIGQRLKTELHKREWTAPELAKRAGIKTSFLYDIMSGKSAHPSTVLLARAADALGVSLTYLAGGEPEQKTAAAYVTIPRLMVDAGSGGSLVSEEKTEERFRFRRAWIEEQLGVSPSDLRMLYVSGDSMEPALCHNDLILVDTTKRVPSPPGVFVLFDGFGLVPKRLEYAGGKKPDRIRILSENPKYSTYERVAEETFIIGRVVWFSREI